MDSSVVVDESVLRSYDRFSLFNSPYPAHDRGCGIDLYPGTDVAFSPVAGTVTETLSVSCPDRPYAVDRDHLIVVEVDRGATAIGLPEGFVARILHVEPSVEAGDCVEIGDPLGTLVRSGFFGQWVANHLHVDFRSVTQHPRRASGSVPIGLPIDVEPIAWDGTGAVVETGPTHARLDAPSHPNPGQFAAIATDSGVPIDGGLTHYGGGGVLSAPTGTGADRHLRLFGTPIGIASGRTVRWDPVDVFANGERITGLSLFADQTGDWGAKLVTIDADFAVGDRVSVTIMPSENPIRLGGRR